jgi:hypothetical protein
MSVTNGECMPINHFITTELLFVNFILDQSFYSSFKNPSSSCHASLKCRSVPNNKVQETSKKLEQDMVAFLADVTEQVSRSFE